MRVIRTLALRGPNCWGRVTCLEVWLDQRWEPPIPERGPDEVAAELLGELGVGVSELKVERGPFPAVWREPSAWTVLVARLGRALQQDAGAPVRFETAAPTSDPEVDRAIVGYHDEPVGREAVAVALRWVGRAARGEQWDRTEERKALRSLHQNTTLGPSTAAIVAALEARGVPCRRLNEASLVQAGHGARQRRILAAETDRTGAIAQEIAKDKQLTRHLMRAAGVPFPEGTIARDAAHAWQIAVELGPPVVVKPSDGNQGRGVSTNLTTREQVEAAYAVAAEVSQTGQVIVERYAPGGDYRILVVGERVVAASRREPPQVVGDGRRTIAELVAEANEDPRRGEDHATALSKIPLDDVSLAVLAAQGYSPTDILPAGRPVLIRRNANLSTGGTAADVTDRVHPEVAQRCIEAARMVGLDIAGIDVVARDVAIPLEEQGGVIVEVNAAPGLRMHLTPSDGRPRPVGEAIADLLYTPGDTGRIPIASITGVNGKTTVTRLIAHLVRQSGRRVGMTCTDGIYLDGRRLMAGDCSGPASARMVLGNPEVEVAVLETARGGILRAGLGFDQCDVAVVTNIGSGDHLGIGDVHSLEDLAWAKGTIVAHVAPTGTAVLNAADPLVRGMAPRCPGAILLFAPQSCEMIEAHVRRGGRAAVVEDGVIVFREAGSAIPVLPLTEIPLTESGRIAFQVENAVAAAAAAWALGLGIELVRKGLSTARSSAESIPGRFNVLEMAGATVIVDYGHNRSALEALIRSLESFPHRERHVVYSGVGDRRDEDMLEQARLLGEHFDSVYLYEDMYMRGRKPGEIIALFRRGLAGAPRAKRIFEFQGGLNAARAALEAVRPGDLLLIQADLIEETVAMVRAFHRERGTGNGAARPIGLTPVVKAAFD
ncbi:MAG: cyanophycin synthetase [Isosphaeraceae bacterium]|jgi:cyanophycin synthetase|nr:MAG: cyanophycin synthetase [Isosphaeraceae bacterium]